MMEVDAPEATMAAEVPEDSLPAEAPAESVPQEAAPADVPADVPADAPAESVPTQASIENVEAGGTSTAAEPSTEHAREDVSMEPGANGDDPEQRGTTSEFPAQQTEAGNSEAPAPGRRSRSKWSDATSGDLDQTSTDAAGNGIQQDGSAAGADGLPGQQDGSLPGPPGPPPPPARRHRWGAPMDAPAAEGAPPKRKKRSRWEEPEAPSQAIVVAAPAGMSISKFTFPKEVKLSSGITVVLPQSLTGDSSDPKIRAMHEQLREVERKIESGEVYVPPEGQRSPSPEPVYDKNGVRLNTRELRYKEKLLETRHRLIEDLIKDDPQYKPPADYRPRKFTAKVRIPQDEFPTYNFIGLLIGPRGNTQKRMQQETNTKIAIRGRGSVKEGANKDPRHDHGEDEELHVLVTGNTQQDCDRAVAMIELLCRPDDDSLNEHKRLQLRELAALNGTLKDEVACPICGDVTHRGYECPTQNQELYVLPDNIKAKVEEQYARDVARVRGAEAVASEDDYKTFLKELGGAPPPELMGELQGLRRGLGAGIRGRDLPDDCKLYVGSLPGHYNDAMLKAAFEPYGNVSHSAVVMDQITGQSRNFGFVHFDDAATARAACDAMHGKVLEGRSLVVRVRSDPMENRGPRTTGAPGGTPFHDNVNTLYVTALNPTITEATLRQVFEEYGKVVECRLIIDRVTNVSKGFAFVTMSSADEVNAAMAGANGLKLEGRAMVVKKAGEKTSGPPPYPQRDARPEGGYTGSTGDHQGRIHTPQGAPPGAPWGQPPPPAYPPRPMGPPGHFPPPGMPGAMPVYGMPPPGPYGPPMLYGSPPPIPYGAPPGPYGAPVPVYLPPGAPFAPPAAPGAYPPYGQPPNPYGAYAPPPAYAQPQQAPPLPGQQPAYPNASQQPPLPSEPAPPVPAAPPAPPPQQVQSEYEKFMNEMQKTFQ